jgi:hypothetical protein
MRTSKDLERHEYIRCLHCIRFVYADVLRVVCLPPCLTNLTR